MNKSMTIVAVLVLAYVSGAQAEVVMETVPVGNAGNTGELSGAGAGGHGPDAIVGGVAYEYNIGKYEVTTGQYTEFLNAVAAEDAFGLYHTYMWESIFGCKIERSGNPGSYAYSVASAWADRPVTDVSWGDALRFANWMHNGQPTGAQDVGTTEDGSYLLEGATSSDDLLTIARAPNATWVLPSENEWHKSAYHKNDGMTGNYFNYTTSNDSVPSNNLIEPDPGNNANFYAHFDDYTIGSPYYRTNVGEFENSESPYGTFDQGGNVWEWNETVINSLRGMRGGSYQLGTYNLSGADRYTYIPSNQDNTIGFRLGCVPEPATLPLLFIGGMMLRRRR